MVRIPLSPTAKNLLGDHFEIYPILFAPFYYIFGSYTLLLFQIVSILLGGVGIYKYIEYKTGNAWLSRLAVIHFFSFWGIYTSLAFDYHNNVVSAMVLPWFLYYFDKAQFRKATLVFIFIIIGKENMPLWMGFVGLSLAIWHIKDRQKLIAASAYTLAGFAFFIVTVKILIPAFAPVGEGYAYNTFQALGKDFGEVAKTALIRPWYTVSLLFKNHLGLPEGDYVKIWTHFAIIISGGWALFWKPKYLVMLLPIYGQKMFYDEVGRWGVYNHYCIEFAPVITLALFIALHKLFKNKEIWLRYSAMISVILTFGLTFYILELTFKLPHKNGLHRFYSGKHYTREFDVKEVYHALKLIPDNASVTAQSILVPHLSFRDTIYQYPVGLNSEYCVLISVDAPFGTTKIQLEEARKKYSTDLHHEIIYDKNDMLIIKRK
jgi:uncharacterized membrane protein